MGWGLGVSIYFLIWWVVLFAVLPWGVRVPDQPEEGHATSAPSNPHLWRKAVATTVVSGLIWVVVYFAIHDDWLALGQP